jgi:hypothetical protein
MRCLWLINVMCRAKFLYTVIFMTFTFLTSCDYGPPRIYTNIENVRAKPASHIVAVSVKYKQLRDPTGINTFPNGCVSKVLDEKAKIYLCDIDTSEIRKVASLSPPKNMKNSWQPWVLGWANDNLFFKMTGQAGTKLKDFKNLNTIIYQLDLNGKLSEVNEIPEDVTFQSNTGPLPQNKFVRISKGHNKISIKTEELKGWQMMFKTEDTYGELISAIESPK